MKKSKKTVSVRALARKTNHDRDSISKWIEGAATEEEALKLIAERKGAAKAISVDPTTGMSWWQARLREDVMRLRAEREERDAIQQEKWMLTSDHFKIIAAITGRLEQVPGKVSSEQGLSPGQTLGLRKALDEAREVAANEIEAMA
jgi:hypothetical protein